jgi:hypothetical protein
MATKAIKKEKVSTSKKDEKILNKKEEPNTVQNSEMADMKAKMETLEKLLALATMQNKTTTSNVDEEDVVLGCNMVYGVTLSDATGESKIELKYGTENTITESEFKRILRKSSTKDLLRDGIIYFANEDDYTKFKIAKYKDISDDILISIFSKERPILNDIISQLNVLTDNRKNDKVIHSILYRICNMLRNKEIKDLSYEIRMGLEDYFNFKFERGMEFLNSLNLTK